MDIEEEINSGSSDEEIEKTSKELEQQRHVFEQMTELLKAQQETLRCNLQALQSKVTKLGPSKKEKGSDQFRNSSEEKLPRLDTSSSASTSGKNEKSDKINFEDGGRQWSQSGSHRNCMPYARISYFLVTFDYDEAIPLIIFVFDFQMILRYALSAVRSSMILKILMH